MKRACQGMTCLVGAARVRMDRFVGLPGYVFGFGVESANCQIEDAMKNALSRCG